MTELVIAILSAVLLLAIPRLLLDEWRDRRWRRRLERENRQRYGGGTWWGRR